MAMVHGIQNKATAPRSFPDENSKSRFKAIFKAITEDCLRIPSGREALVLLCLASAGVLGNYLSLGLFFGVDFIFGSIATMIALRISGTLWGTIVGVAVGSYTILLWGHPYAVVIFGLEAFVAGFFLCGLKKDNAALIDAGFWVAIGMPLVWVFYTYRLGLPETAVELIMLKQAVNGIFNMVVASLVLQFTPLRHWVRGEAEKSKSWPLQQVLNTLLAGTVLAPILIVTALSSRGELEQIQGELNRDISIQLNHAKDVLSEQVATMGKLATVIAADALYEPEHAVKETASILQSFPEFLGFGVVKADGTVVASYQRGKEPPGRYANFPLSSLPDTTLIWRPGDGRDGVGDSLAVVTFVAEHDIYAIGWLRPGLLANKLSALAGDRNWKLDLRDRDGRLIASSNPKLNLQDFVPGANPHHLLPANTGLPAMVRWRKSFWVKQAPTGIGDGWSLSFAGSLTEAIDILQEDTVEKLFLAFVVSALTLLLAPFAVRAVHRPLEQLTMAVRQLTESTARTDVIWPQGAISEIETLVAGFKGMLDSVNENAAKLRDAEKAASKAANELRALIDTANAPIFGIDLEGRVNEWNQNAATITGFAKDEAMGRDLVAEFIADDHKASVTVVLDKALKGEETANYEFSLATKSGDRVDVLLNSTTRRNSKGEITGVVGIGQDVTEHNKMVSELLESENLFRTFFDNMPTATVKDLEGEFIKVNKMWREWFDPDDVGAGNYKISIIPDKNHRMDVADLEKLVIETGMAQEKELRIFLASGELRTTLMQKFPIFNSENKLVNIGGINTDITELKQTQAQVIQASKLATLGEMATGVAHELNQPLNIIRMASGNIRRKLEKGNFDPEYLNRKLERIQGQTERAAAIIDHMRMFGRTAEGDDQKLDPRTVITNALDLMGEQLRLSQIEVVTELPDECPSITGNIIRMEQVVLNLLANSRDAIEDQDGEKKIILRIVEENGGVQIITEDTGGGIPNDVLPRVFEPFYTTKEMGKGTGLGMSVSYGIIRDMGGSIVAENFNGGARITITLPTS